MCKSPAAVVLDGVKLFGTASCTHNVENLKKIENST
jgi:hypothetical protein